MNRSTSSASRMAALAGRAASGVVLRQVERVLCAGRRRRPWCCATLPDARRHRHTRPATAWRPARCSRSLPRSRHCRSRQARCTRVSTCSARNRLDQQWVADVGLDEIETIQRQRGHAAVHAQHAHVWHGQQLLRHPSSPIAADAGNDDRLHQFNSRSSRSGYQPDVAKSIQRSRCPRCTYARATRLYHQPAKILNPPALSGNAPYCLAVLSMLSYS